MEQYETILKSLGIETFIKYYYSFKKMNPDEILKKIKSNKEEWTVNTQYTKVSNGISIFKKDINEQILLYIIYKVKTGRITEETREKAKEIYNKIEFERNLLANYVEKSLGELSENVEEDLFWQLRDIEEERKNITG